MINTEVTTTKGVEQAQRAVEQAKNRLANEKKKAHAERRKQENAHKYMMGGVVHNVYFTYPRRSYGKLWLPPEDGRARRRTQRRT